MSEGYQNGSGRAEWQQALVMPAPCRPSSPAASVAENEAAMRQSLAAADELKRRQQLDPSEAQERQRQLAKMLAAMRQVPWVQGLVRLTDRNFSADDD